ncbi:hypothetical protein NAPIS_ORF00328 [Vairimorpha apis BRL 01]|uniref:Uncharacterized protein n=1 Tax=Vairimorpha apis BRL 01 TaxID=1037528 RepID=T0LCR9_9MICR|nr:hypothetical protein NAPIS_ORF00328 [Vairimorpha apis BRL 01]
MFILKKLPSQVLVLDYLSTVSANLIKQIQSYNKNINVDFLEHDKKYDLVFLCNYVFEFDLNFYKTVSSAEIIFRRNKFTFNIFMEGLKHYSECQIRNGA